MLSDDHINEFTARAVALAKETSPANLRRMAEVTGREHDRLAGDERTEIGIMHSAYVAEMQRRGIS